MTTTINLAGMSRREMLATRADLVTKARAMVKDVEEKNGGKLSASDEAQWDRFDADIEALTEQLEKTPQADLKERLAKWDKDVEKDPGRLSLPSIPGGGSGESKGQAELKFNGEPLDLPPGEMAFLNSLNTSEYDAKFKSYLRGNTKAESLGMKIGEDAKGGVLASMGWVQQMIKFVDDLVLMRQLGTVIPTNGAVSMGAVSWDTDPGDADWTPEVPATDIAEDDGARLGTRELVPHGFSKLVKISRKLRQHHPQIVAFLISRLGYKAAVTEEKAFINGDGLQKPLGVAVAHANGITSSQDVETLNSVSIVFDDFINALFDLKQQYWGSGSWLMSRQCLKTARKLKDSQNQYLWQPAVKDGTPSTILDRPYNLSEFFPGQTAASWTAGVYVAMYGDWKHYWIVDSLQQTIDILEELFALKKQIGFLLTKETDGQPVLAEAFRRIKLKA